ncbi:MAG: DKNYY domain-containing protein [Ferruginibacter sp.]
MFKLIKWAIKTVLVLTGILPLFRCSSGYKQKDGKVTFNGKEITDKSFVVLSEEFAKDSTTAWYKERPFSYADVATFEAVDEHYAKDKNKVYFCDEYREGQNYYLTKKQTITELKNAQPTSFVSLKNGYGKDHSHAWFQGIPFAVKDVSSFVTIDNHFAKDDIQAYLNLKPIAGSKGRTFELIDRNFAKDTAHIYYYGYTGEGQHNICILPCDRQSFEIIDYRYSKDNVNVFFLGFIVKGADAPTFKLLPNDYTKDKNTVYFRERKIEGVDPATFEVYKENDEVGHDVVFARDKSVVFMDDKKVKDAEVATFKVLGENYGSDSKYVFYKTRIVKGANPASFKVYPHDVGNADSEDATNKYHEGIKVVD